jgi:hypothetical protein
VSPATAQSRGPGVHAKQRQARDRKRTQRLIDQAATAAATEPEAQRWDRLLVSAGRMIDPVVAALPLRLQEPPSATRILDQLMLTHEPTDRPLRLVERAQHAGG